MNRYLLLLITAIFLNQSVLAIEIRGTTSCGKWIQEREAKGWAALSNQSWLIGFLSGIAIGLDIDITTGKDNPSLFLWVDNYCKANPLKDLDDAGMALAGQIIKDRKK